MSENRKLTMIRSTNFLSSHRDSKKETKQKMVIIILTLLTAVVGVFGSLLLYFDQIQLQEKQNNFLEELQKKQNKRDSVLEEKKFEYSIIQKSSELPSIVAVVTNLDNYIKLNFLKGGPDKYKKLLKENRWEDIPWTHRSFIFNVNKNDLPLLMVANATTNPCNAGPANGCWTTSISAKPGDLVSVQLYFHNTSDTIAKKVVGSIFSEWMLSTQLHVFYGALASDKEIDRDSAVVITEKLTYLALVPGSVRFYPNQSTRGRTIYREHYLFSPIGINIGDIRPGWKHQGTIVADFKVIEKI